MSLNACAQWRPTFDRCQVSGAGRRSGIYRGTRNCDSHGVAAPMKSLNPLRIPVLLCASPNASVSPAGAAVLPRRAFGQSSCGLANRRSSSCESADVTPSATARPVRLSYRCDSFVAHVAFTRQCSLSWRARPFLHCASGQARAFWMKGCFPTRNSLTNDRFNVSPVSDSGRGLTVAGGEADVHSQGPRRWTAGRRGRCCSSPAECIGGVVRKPSIHAGYSGSCPANPHDY